MLPTQSTKVSTYCKDSKTEWSHTRANKSQKHVVQETSALFLSSEHFILTQRHGENDKNTTSFAD